MSTLYTNIPDSTGGGGGGGGTVTGTGTVNHVAVFDAASNLYTPGQLSFEGGNLTLREGGGLDIANVSEDCSFIVDVTSSTPFMTIRRGPDAASFFPDGAGLHLSGANLLIEGHLGVNNSAAATTLGTVVKKIEIFDESGSSLGFIAVYNAIT